LNMVATIISNSPEETRRAGESWARELAGGPGGVVLGLVGPLGAGKTEFVKGLALGLGVSDLVTSPTFTLVHEHAGNDGVTLYHVDLYRLKSQEEMLALGLEEMICEGSVLVVEWADRFPSFFGSETRWIGFEEGPVGRTIRERTAP
jgi:tRNA threonylcarbamoyladenosine biosynthesis protein TsaE